MRLDVRVLRSEELLGAFNGQRLDLINKFTATVPAFAGITFGVFVGQDAAGRFHDRRIGEIF